MNEKIQEMLDNMGRELSEEIDEMLLEKRAKKVQRGKIYVITEELLLKWERGEVLFKDGNDRVKPLVRGRAGDGYNVSFG